MKYKAMLPDLTEPWKMDICIQILDYSTSATEVEIISGTSSSLSVSPTIVRECLAILVEMRFIDYDKAGENYTMTERGKNFAAIFHEVWETLMMEEQSAGPMYFNSLAES